MARVFQIDILAVLFGLGTWVCVNGLWVELPLFVQTLPEAWNLPSYLAVVIQIANLAPLTYSVLTSFFPKVVTEKRTIYFTILIGSISTFLVAFFWKSTTYLWGAERSVGLLSLVLFMAMVDCSSRVLYLPFMSKFKEIYLTSFFIGEGLSGFVPSIFAIIQGVGGNPECRLVNETTVDDTVIWKYEAYTKPPRFSIEVFFYFLLTIVLASAVAFHLLNYESVVEKALAILNRQSVTSEIYYSRSRLNSIDRPQTFYQSTSPTISLEKLAHLDPDGIDQSTLKEKQIENNNSIIIGENAQTDYSREARVLPKSLFVYVLVIQLFACMFSNGVFPSIQSYSCLPYGNGPYHLVATLSTISNPAVCFLLFVIPKPTKRSVTVVFILAMLVASYLMTTAVESPSPPLVNKLEGEILLVVGWILFVAFFTYVKVSVATILRSDGKRGLFWCGAVTQTGSAIGAVVTFFIVNFTTTFQSFNACPEFDNNIASTIASQDI